MFLFKRAGEKRKELSPAQKTEMLAQLKDEYGIEIFQDDWTEEKAEASGYRKATEEEAARLSAALRFVPQLVVDAGQRSAVQKAFQAAVDGTYRLKMSAGLHLEKSLDTPGAFRAMAKDVKNKLVESPELLENDAVLELSKAPQIALGVFNAVSFVTGQYFMSTINAKLSDLSAGIDRVERFLKDVEASRFHAACQELKEIMDRLDSIKKDGDQISSAIEQIHAVQRIAREKINFSREQLERLFKGGAEDKEDEIRRQIEAYRESLCLYRNAVQLFAVATFLEALLWNEFKGVDVDRLRDFQRQMDEKTEAFESDFQRWKEQSNQYLNDNVYLNGHPFPRDSFSFLSILNSLSQMFDDGRDAQKEYKEQIKRIRRQNGDFEALRAPAGAVAKYVEAMDSGVEVIRIGDAFYTNLPASAGIQSR